MNRLAKDVLEYLTPVLKESKFETDGVLTPEEYVAAGDLLVFKCPTWQWEAGDADKAKPYLPPNKQYLITRNVPCEQRVSHLHTGLHDTPLTNDSSMDDDSDWVATSVQREDQTTSLAIPDITHAIKGDFGTDGSAPMEIAGPSTAPSPAHNTTTTTTKKNNNNDDKDNINDDDSVPDMENYVDDNLVEDDPAALTPYIVREEPPDNILRTRTYDLSITYDKYYQTPRFWLFGYDEHHQPLTTEQIFEDISQDHAKKTVTIEPHPHTSLNHAGIHPCRHAATMKKIVANVNAGSDPNSEHRCRVDQYLFLFLKFISAVVPTIDYDYTIDIKGR
eukprot:c11682_g2_i1.p1 GENE.c11682_g2_i1~~c11682_g2_i1.p1  ORF type:complete len:333 (+),score=95.93 c11682_g2_i1:80-1078(+)